MIAATGPFFDGMIDSVTSLTGRGTSRRKPRILVFNRSYLPGYRAGGPIRTLANMVARLGEEFDFRVVTLDRDAGDSRRYPDIPDAWATVGNAQVRYMPPGAVSLRALEQLVRQVSADVLYLNSFFDLRFTQKIFWLRRTGRLGDVPIVLAPRGEFSAGALGLKSVKKGAYLKLAKVLGLYENLLWQASTTYERADIRRHLPFVSDECIHEALNLAPAGVRAPVGPPVRAPGEPLKVCFLSRISPKKNLDFALRVLAQAKTSILFTIYGPKSDPGYWMECEALVAKSPHNVLVTYGGEVHPSKVRELLAQQELFFFPTRGENYGHVIHEALDAGLPVLISDQTPWTDVTVRQVGWILPLEDEAAFARRIDDFARSDAGSVAEMRLRAQAFARERSEDEAALEANRRLFLKAISKRTVSS